MLGTRVHTDSPLLRLSLFTSLIVMFQSWSCCACAQGCGGVPCQALTEASLAEMPGGKQLQAGVPKVAHQEHVRLATRPRHAWLAAPPESLLTLGCRHSCCLEPSTAVRGLHTGTLSCDTACDKQSGRQAYLL